VAASAETVVRTLKAVAPGEDAAAATPQHVHPGRTRALLGLLTAIGVPLLLLSLRTEIASPQLSSLLLIAGAFSLGALRMDAYGSIVSLSPVAVVAAGALGGPAAGALAGLATALGALSRTPRSTLSIFKIVGNLDSMSLAGAASSLPFLLISVSSRPSLLWLPLVGAASALALCAVNCGTICPLFAWSNGGGSLQVWRERFRWMVPQTTALCMTGAGLAAAYRAVGVYEVFAFTLPVAAMYIAWQQYLAHTRHSVEELRTKNSDLVSMTNRLQVTNEKLSETYRGTLEALIGALDARDNETEGHSYRVSAYSQIVAEKMGIERGSTDWETIARGALLHDVGKVGVRDAVLLKPSGLTDEEWVEMRSHAGIGYGILAQVEFLRPAAELVWAHHEKYDGTGYPRGLKGEQIPLGSRIFSVADAFDAMTSDRPYRKAMPPDAALEELRRCAGTQFDPEVVAIFDELWEQIWSSRARARQMVA
jgi:putative nucleotidyltransferase with HDIG domain